MRNIFRRKKRYNVAAAVDVTTSCEDNKTLYLDFPDGLRLIIREGEYVGWYLPGEVQE